MVHRLLLAAAVVAAAAAVGEYKMVLQGCGCGDPVQTYNTTTAAFCPTSQYPSCNISKMSVSDNTCSFSCTGPRSRLVYRNNSVVWLATTSISCEKNTDGVTGTLKNSEGETLYNVLRPTCAYKAACDACNITYQPTCPTGMTCKEANLERTTGSDDCSQLACKDGKLNLYTSNGAQMPYIARMLLCTVVGKWTNYSIDGSIVGGTLINETISANCVLPKACEECVDPNWTTNLAALPTPFRTGYVAIAGTHSKEAGSCSEFTCPTGYTLYGFSGSSTAVTGLEYTSKGKLRCSGTSQWTNGGVENIPSNMLAACLKVIPPCQKCASDLLSVTAFRYLAKPMDGDVTTISGSCTMRTFTCNAKPAYIEIFGVNGQYLGVIPDEFSGAAIFNVSCNAAGTAWESYGLAIGRVECVGPPACTTCASSLIAVTQTVPNSKPFDSDVVSTVNGCAQRTLTCKGKHANIGAWMASTLMILQIFRKMHEAKANDVLIMQGWEAATGSGSVAFTLSCNAAGAAWEMERYAITRVECVVPPVCQTCTYDLIDSRPRSPGSKEMDGDVYSISNGCGRRTFTCKGKNAIIEVWGTDDTYLMDIIDWESSGSITLTVSCNAAGAAWEDAGHVIARVECIVPPLCQTCAANLIKSGAPYPKEMTSDAISTASGCAERTFTCSGTRQVVIIAYGVDDKALWAVPDGGTGTANANASCNTDGTAWVDNKGNVIGRVVCIEP